MARLASRAAPAAAAAALALALAAVVLARGAGAHSHRHQKPFAVGDRVELECRDAEGGWSGGVNCTESGERLSFEFGRDSFLYCAWTLRDDAEYERLRRVLAQEETYECRVPMSADRSFYLPVTLQMWGLVEATHVHVNYHMNFVFHAAMGTLLGASSYPVRDRLQFVKTGSTINLHGPVHWFSGHSFVGFADGGTLPGRIPPRLRAVANIAGWMLLTAAVTSLAFVALYQLRLKPQLAKRYLKAD